jgi:MATE family multidrug resistance protein
MQSHALLLQLGQQPDIAALASRYLILCIPCLFLTTTMECIRKYLQSQRAVKPAMAVSAAVLVASPLFFWLLVEKFQLGLDGAALAFIACQVTTLLGLLGYVVYRSWRLQGKREQTWGGWSGEALQGWGEYCSYGLPAAAMIAGEWWAYEVRTQWGVCALNTSPCSTARVLQRAVDPHQLQDLLGPLSACPRQASSAAMHC